MIDVRLRRAGGAGQLGPVCLVESTHYMLGLPSFVNAVLYTGKAETNVLCVHELQSRLRGGGKTLHQRLDG